MNSRTSRATQWDTTSNNKKQDDTAELVVNCDFKYSNSDLRLLPPVIQDRDWTSHCHYRSWIMLEILNPHPWGMLKYMPGWLNIKVRATFQREMGVQVNHRLIKVWSVHTCAQWKQMWKTEERQWDMVSRLGATVPQVHTKHFETHF